METAVVRQFLDVFQDYMTLCLSNKWPDDNISPEEIRNAFLVSSHVEKCIEKLQKKMMLVEFLNTLILDQKESCPTFKNCFIDPPKYILKKIIQSKININKVDITFKIFLELFTEEKLETYLSAIMVETASNELLLIKLPLEFSKEKILIFKSQLLLSELINSENIQPFVKEMLKDCSRDMMDTLVLCLLNKDIRYANVVNGIVNAFLNNMLSKDVSNKAFWKLLLGVKPDDFVQLCLYNSDLFKTISKALIDCARLIKENMSAEYFYIDLTYFELVTIMQIVCKNDNLKLEFLDIISTSNSDLEFWNNIMKL